MSIPSVMLIEMGAAIVREHAAPADEALRRKELNVFGDTRARRIGASGLSDDFAIGYELGLATAQVLGKGSVRDRSVGA